MLKLVILVSCISDAFLELLILLSPFDVPKSGFILPTKIGGFICPIEVPELFPNKVLDYLALGEPRMMLLFNYTSLSYLLFYLFEFIDENTLPLTILEGDFNEMLSTLF